MGTKYRKMVCGKKLRFLLTSSSLYDELKINTDYNDCSRFIDFGGRLIKVCLITP